MGFFRGLWGGWSTFFQTEELRAEGTEAQCKTHMHYFLTVNHAKLL